MEEPDLRKHMRFFLFSLPKLRHVFLLVHGSQPTGELIKISNVLLAFIFMQVLAPLPGDEQPRYPLSICWVVIPPLPSLDFINSLVRTHTTISSENQLSLSPSAGHFNDFGDSVAAGNLAAPPGYSKSWVHPKPHTRNWKSKEQFQ